MATIKFYYNGLKVDGGKLQKASYSFQSEWTTGNRTVPTQLTLYGKNYKSFSKDVCDALTVQNDSDLMTDYFEQDRIRIQPGHPLFVAAAKGYVKHTEKIIARMAKRGYDVKQEQETLAAFVAEYIAA